MGNIICPNCGVELDDSVKFCTNCGTNLSETIGKIFCSECGLELENSVKFCPNCGTRTNDVEQFNIESNFNKNNNTNNENFEDSRSNRSFGGGFIANKLKKSKAVDAIFDKTASLGYKQIDKVDSSANRKLFEKTEPVFLEVFDSIEDNFIKAILLFEREKHNTVDGYGIIGAVATTVNTPTNGMSHDEAIQFYLEIVENIENEIAKEKQMGVFDEEKFYKKKQKESSLSKISF